MCCKCVSHIAKTSTSNILVASHLLGSANPPMLSVATLIEGWWLPNLMWFILLRVREDINHMCSRKFTAGTGTLLGEKCTSLTQTN